MNFNQKIHFHIWRKKVMEHRFGAFRQVYTYTFNGFNGLELLIFHKTDSSH